MGYIIDGHNLIPKIPGLSLRAMDDEQQLIEVLQEFCRLQRKQVEVYFDNAPPGQDGARRFGAVTAHFVRQGSTADDAIRRRLSRLGGQAANWTVVTSDGAVQAAARMARAHFVSSEAFSKQLGQALAGKGGQGEKPSAPGDLDEWLEIFGDDK